MGNTCVLVSLPACGLWALHSYSMAVATALVGYFCSCLWGIQCGSYCPCYYLFLCTLVLVFGVYSVDLTVLAAICSCALVCLCACLWGAQCGTHCPCYYLFLCTRVLVFGVHSVALTTLAICSCVPVCLSLVCTVWHSLPLLSVLVHPCACLWGVQCGSYCPCYYLFLCTRVLVFGVYSVALTVLATICSCLPVCLSLGCTVWTSLSLLLSVLVHPCACLWGAQCGPHCPCYYLLLCTLALVFGVYSVDLTALATICYCAPLRLSLGCTVWTSLLLLLSVIVHPCACLWGVQCGTHYPCYCSS